MTIWDRVQQPCRHVVAVAATATNLIAQPPAHGKALIGNSNEAEFGLEVRPVITGRRRR